MAKTLQQMIADAEERGNRYLAEAKETIDQGKKAKAGKLDEKGQFWLDMANKLRAWGE